jgi:hypothetical protein
MEEKKPINPQDPFAQFSEGVKLELAILVNMDKFLRRLKDITGDEAMEFVRCREYIKLTMQNVMKRENVRLEAQKKLEEARAKTEKVEKPVETPKVSSDNGAGELGHS